jgi:acyl-coenzyme A thioesterase PaaI-like protein
MIGFTYLPRLIENARSSDRWLMVLNRLMRLLIPFNGPHGVKILELGLNRVRTGAPCQRKNYNHIRSMHACVIATIGEYSAGMMLISRLDPTRYRLIMSNLEVEYLFQAKQDIVAETLLEEDELENEILQSLAEKGVAFKSLETLVTDADGRKIARVKTRWQIKSWDKVRTRT